MDPPPNDMTLIRVYDEAFTAAITYTQVWDPLVGKTIKRAHRIGVVAALTYEMRIDHMLDDATAAAVLAAIAEAKLMVGGIPDED